MTNKPPHIAAKLSRIENPEARENSLATDEMLHELRVHKIELEMQNDELRRTQVALEEAKDRYLNLFEYAPAGYITISRDNTILEINLTGATLLGVERKQIIHRRFTKFISPPDHDNWHRQFIAMIQEGEGSRRQIEIAMIHADGSAFFEQQILVN